MRRGDSIEHRSDGGHCRPDYTPGSDTLRRHGHGRLPLLRPGLSGYQLRGCSIPRLCSPSERADFATEFISLLGRERHEAADLFGDPERRSGPGLESEQSGAIDVRLQRVGHLGQPEWRATSGRQPADAPSTATIPNASGMTEGTTSTSAAASARGEYR